MLVISTKPFQSCANTEPNSQRSLKWFVETRFGGLVPAGRWTSVRNACQHDRRHQARNVVSAARTDSSVVMPWTPYASRSHGKPAWPRVWMNLQLSYPIDRLPPSRIECGPTGRKMRLAFCSPTPVSSRMITVLRFARTISPATSSNFICAVMMKGARSVKARF